MGVLNMRIHGRSNLNKWIGWFPPLYFIHDLEEILTIEKFLHSKSTVIPLQINTKEFTLAFLLLFIIAVVGCYFASKQKRFLRMTHTTFFSFLVPGILLANGAGHLLQSIFFKGYVPGVITSIVIIFPYSIITLKHLLKEHILTKKRFLFLFILGCILQAPLAGLALLTAKIIL